MSNNNTIYIDRLFPYIEKSKLSKLMINKEIISYITTPATAKQICNIIRNYFKKYDVQMDSIIDCTACVGGDTIALANVFSEVVSIEIDPERYNMLQNNVNVYKLKNVKVYNADCIELLKHIEYSQAIYFDPPWGGSEYKSTNNLRLFIGHESIEKLTIDLIYRRYTQKPPRFIIFKLPKNYDIHYFFTTVTKKDEINIYLHRLKKINIIVVVNKYTDNEYVIIE
jgi:16S rRNA G966 N2-methylase RsmD